MRINQIYLTGKTINLVVSFRVALEARPSTKLFFFGIGERLPTKVLLFKIKNIYRWKCTKIGSTEYTGYFNRYY